MTKHVFPSSIENVSNKNIEDSGQPFIHITLHKWEIHQKNEQQPLSKSTKVHEYFLAIPETTIQEQYNHSWDNGLDASQLIGTGISKIAKVALDKIVNSRYAAVKALGSGVDIYQARKGILINDFIAQNYQGIDFRQFEFLFNMIPRSDKEAQTIYDILSTLKEATTPDYSQVEIMFPNVVQFAIYTGTEKKQLLRSSCCGVQTLCMNYSPSGFMRTFKNGRPVQVHLNLTLKELRRYRKGQ